MENNFLILDRRKDHVALVQLLFRSGLYIVNYNSHAKFAKTQ